MCQNQNTSCSPSITNSIHSMAISTAFPWSHFIASTYISSPGHTHTPSAFTHTQRRGSQQGEGQLRGDFNLSVKIHIKPLPSPSYPCRLLRSPLPGTIHSTHHPLLFLLLIFRSPFDSDHRVRLCLFVWSLCFAWQPDRSRQSAHPDRNVCVYRNGRVAAKGKAEGERKTFGGGKCQIAVKWRDFDVSSARGRVKFQVAERRGCS